MTVCLMSCVLGFDPQAYCRGQMHCAGKWKQGAAFHDKNLEPGEIDWMGSLVL